jgi:molecular chaperone HscC
LVARAERLHEEALGEARQAIAGAIVAFEGVLQNGKLETIEEHRQKLTQMLDRIDREFRL